MITTDPAFSLMAIFLTLCLVSGSMLLPVFDFGDDTDRRRQDELNAEEWLSIVAERAVEPQVRKKIAEKQLKRL